MKFDEVMEKFSYLFEEDGIEQDYESANKFLDFIDVREEIAQICLKYLKENVSRMAPITLLTNAELLFIGKANKMIVYEYPVTQFELDFLMALVVKYGEMRPGNYIGSDPQEIENLLKAIRIYFTCLEHRLHKDKPDAFSINLWYRTTRIEGFDKEKLSVITEFCEKFNTESGGSETVNVIKLLHMYDRGIANRLKQLAGGLVCLEEQYDFFVFSKEDIKRACLDKNLIFDNVIRILDMFSCKVGDFEDIDESEIYLKNPITNKFIIRIAEGLFFIPNINVVLENIFDVLKSVAKEFNEDLEAYAKCKSRFLEEETYSLLQKKFGKKAKIYLNSEWEHNGRHGENDCTLVFENYVLIFEDKSGEINKNTPKGIMGSANADSQKLIYEASEQAENFSKLIEENYGKVLPLKVKGGSENRIDLTNANKTICIGIVFDDTYLQYLTINGKRHIPIVSMFQLNKILECLEEAEIVDYFIKRTKIEENILYYATEYDFLYTYLVSGINTSNQIYEKMSEDEKIFFPYKESEITRDDLVREEWFQIVINKCMEQVDENRLDKTISLLEIPPVEQKLIWRELRKYKKIELKDKLASRKKMIVVTLLDYYDSDTYNEIMEDLHYYEATFKEDIENILYIAITQDLEKCVVEMSVKR